MMGQDGTQSAEGSYGRITGASADGQAVSDKKRKAQSKVVKMLLPCIGRAVI
jgi:hypothetical protein